MNERVNIHVYRSSELDVTNLFRISEGGRWQQSDRSAEIGQVFFILSLNVSQ